MQKYSIIDKHGDQYYYDSNWCLMDINGPVTTPDDSPITYMRRTKLPVSGGERNVEFKLWYKNGFKHRDDKPAFITSDGKECWYSHGKKHRDDKPAEISQSGLFIEYYKYGKLHRLDGPAIIWKTYNYEEFWVDGIRIN